MIVPERLRYVIIVALINIFPAACRVAKREANASASQCRQTSNTTLDCSGLSLASIPNDIPNTILALNMSLNQLTLSGSTFGDCCRHLEDLDLSSNGISSGVSRDSFKSLVNVTRLSLRNNSIGDFEADAFEGNEKLEQLDLSFNPLQLQSASEGFLINSRLEELNLDECELSEVPEDAFKGITQLKSLTLSGNPFDEDMDVSAFEDLKSLIRLQIKNISRDTVSVLCKNLVSIDLINFEGFNVSCVILLDDGGLFEDAIVGPDALIEQPVQLPILPAPPTKTTTPPSTSTASTTTLAAPELPTAKSNSSTSAVDTNDQSNSQNSVTNSPDITNHAVVDIDNETIKYILMGILGVTLIGMLIGFVCRADVCGIKTKLCRSKKSTANRRSPADTVSPFEEIPLNTVNTNGKAVEGQG